MGVVDAGSPAVQAHLTIIQGVIDRMASNSASCKAWCIALVSALVVVLAEHANANSNLASVAMIPLVLFWGLDMFYLSLERRFRKSYNAFVEKLHGEGLKTEDVFVVEPGGGGAEEFAKAFFSWSTSPFYIGLGLVAYFVREIVR